MPPLRQLTIETTWAIVEEIGKRLSGMLCNAILGEHVCKSISVCQYYLGEKDCRVTSFCEKVLGAGLCWSF